MAKVNLDLVEEVLDFIDETVNLFEQTPLFTEYNIEAQEYFRRGGCGHFYTIMKAQFPQATPYATYGLGHVLTEIDGVLYDVGGIVIDYHAQPVPNFIEKIVTNYAFTLKSNSWFGTGPGPTNVCFIQTIDEMTEEERATCFHYLSDNNIDFFESFYYDYKRQLEENGDLIDRLALEAEFVVYPDFSNLGVIRCAA